jgi:UTP--glucose-1-phosphate uridylyltransferase
MNLKKVVFPVAGLGLRFLPATKAIPKEMLPVIDKPLIQYACGRGNRCWIYRINFYNWRN